MLSTELIPSCSSSKPSDLAVANAHQHDDDNPSVFSIRDYVLKSRRSDIRINWPFSEQLLNLCLDNGISDILPPLEPPTLVRSYCYQRELEYSKHSSKRADKSILGTGEFLDRSKRSILPEERRDSRINQHKSIHYDLSERISGEQSKNKCRLVASLGIETSTEEAGMASKVCPVCKSFTSTSNTTLNAHIDQCLSSSDQSNATNIAEFFRAKVQPIRKKRLMVDIYKTAPLSTLEDLDRRNGTNWAVSLAMVAPASNDINVEMRSTTLSPLETGGNDVLNEHKRLELPPEDINNVSKDASMEITKRMKLSPVDAVSEGNVGDIYVDSNGMKILILSKFDDSPSLLSRKKFKMKKHEKELKSGKSCSVIKKKILKQKCLEFMKDSPQSRKPSAVSGLYSEIEEPTEGDHISEADQEREESRSLLLNATEQAKSIEPSTLGHWVCSKRSEISRKQANKDMDRRPEKISVDSKKLSFRHTQPDSQRSCALNLPSSSSSVASPKTKCMNILSDTQRSLDARRKIPSPNLKAKFLEGDSLVEDSTVRMPCLSKAYHLPLKGRKSLISKESFLPRRTCISLEELDEDEGPRFIIPKKFRKHRSILRCSKGGGGEKHYNANLRSNGSSRDNEASDIHDDHSDLSDNQEKGRSTVAAAPVHGTNLNSNTEEQVDSLSPNGAIAQRSTSCDQEAQCGDAVSNEASSQEIQREGNESDPICHHGEFQADTSFQDHNLCITSDGGVALETIQESALMNMVRVESSENHHTIMDMDSSGSAVSTISARPSVDDKIKSTEADRLAEYNPLPGKMSSPVMRKDNNITSCSCSESLARESHFANHRKITNLSIKPPEFIPFQQVCPSLESRDGSVVTMDSSKSSTSNAVTPCSGSQTASNPILRLMGKDLVVSKDESTHLPNISPHDSSQASFVSFAAPSNVGFLSYANPYGYPMQSFANHHIPINAPSPWGVLSRTVVPHHHQPRPTAPTYPPAHEVIVIDDDSHGLEPDPRMRIPTWLPAVQNPNLMTPQRMFACFPSQNPYASKAFAPSQREAQEGAFMFPSPSSLYAWKLI